MCIIAATVLSARAFGVSMGVDRAHADASSDEQWPSDLLSPNICMQVVEARLVNRHVSMSAIQRAYVAQIVQSYCKRTCACAVRAFYHRQVVDHHDG